MFTEELARERTRDQLELARDLRVAGQLRALERAKRNERKAERRLVEAWRARAAVESVLGLR
jgi:hypothetical protein